MVGKFSIRQMSMVCWFVIPLILVGRDLRQFDLLVVGKDSGRFSFNVTISSCRYKPDVIKGDMDSIRPEVKEYYSNLVTTLIYI